MRTMFEIARLDKKFVMLLTQTGRLKKRPVN